MHWRWKALFFAVGFIAAAPIGTVRADEAYLCDGGRIVYVPWGKLEEMKRTDACIARYYGVEIAAVPPTTSAPTLPAPATSAASPATPSGQPLRLETLPDAEDPARTARTPGHPRRPLGPPRAAEGTDYRNVPIINAADASAAVFRHER